jgi:hypothetical protein
MTDRFMEESNPQHGVVLSSSLHSIVCPPTFPLLDQPLRVARRKQTTFAPNGSVVQPNTFRFDTAGGRTSGTSDHWPAAINLVRR